MGTDFTANYDAETNTLSRRWKELNKRRKYRICHIIYTPVSMVWQYPAGRASITNWWQNHQHFFRSCFNCTRHNAQETASNSLKLDTSSIRILIILPFVPLFAGVKKQPWNIYLHVINYYLRIVFQKCFYRYLILFYWYLRGILACCLSSNLSSIYIKNVEI